MFKITDISAGLQSSGATVQQNNSVLKELRNPSRTPQEYLLTEIQSVTEGAPSMALESSVYNHGAGSGMPANRPSQLQALSACGQGEFFGPNSPYNGRNFSQHVRQ